MKLSDDYLDNSFGGLGQTPLDYSYYTLDDNIRDSPIYETRIYTHAHEVTLFSINIFLATLTVVLNSGLIYFISGKSFMVFAIIR